MKKILFFSVLLATIFMSGCKKDNETDLSTKWVGIYNDPASVPNNGISTAASLNNIIVNKVNGSTLKIQMKAIETNYLYTYATLKNVTLNGANKGVIDEMANLTESTGQYRIKGNVVLNGNQITLNATATNMASAKESDVKNLHFTGTLNQ